uniref:Uncharacterized protein n=1 Tax=Anguilla anguilla TaxID=7936 RepID=A0A0E9V2M6_ANGAN
MVSNLGIQPTLYDLLSPFACISALQFLGSAAQGFHKITCRWPSGSRSSF